jgi:hypothetical protein
MGLVRIGLLLATAVCLSCAYSAALAQSTPYRASDWRERPSEAEIAAVWPPQVKAGEYEGDVVLECSVAADGAPRDCLVIKEDIEGQGFGAAALGLTDKFRMKRPRDGKAFIAIELRAPGYVPTDWLKRPRAEDIAGVWPTDALRSGTAGRAVIECLVNLQGGLVDCKVQSEEPAGANFGAAAIALTPQLLMRPASLNGKPVVSKVRIPINFQAPEGSTGTRTAAGDDFGAKTVVDAARSWTAAPTHADVVAAYPKKARDAQTAGRATLSCGFNSKGALTDCYTVTEEPRGLGFGAAARDLAKLFRVDPGPASRTDLNGLMVQLPVTFATEMLSPQRPTIGKPKWTQLPSAEEAGDAYPPAARAASIWTGRAALACQVEAQGSLVCAVESESPAGHGFGAAAMKLAPYFRLATWTNEGLPVVGGAVRIPIKFQAPEETPPAAP